MQRDTRIVADAEQPSILDKPHPPRSPCPLVLARTLLVDAAMIEDPRKSETTNGQANGHSTVRVVRQVKHADDRLVAIVSQNPLAALGIALACGYVLGRIVTRHG